MCVYCMIIQLNGRIVEKVEWLQAVECLRLHPRACLHLSLLFVSFGFCLSPTACLPHCVSPSSVIFQNVNICWLRPSPVTKAGHSNCECKSRMKTQQQDCSSPPLSVPFSHSPPSTLFSFTFFSRSEISVRLQMEL